MIIKAVFIWSKIQQKQSYVEKIITSCIELKTLF